MKILNGRLPIYETGEEKWQKHAVKEELFLRHINGTIPILIATYSPALEAYYRGDIEKIIWEGRTLNSTIVVVARADAKMPVTGEVLQVRRANIVGSQGHSGHGTFPRVIAAMAGGMNMLPMMTKTIALEDVPEHIVMLRTDRRECKITCLMD